MTQLSLGALGGVQLDAEVDRGAWCSPPEWCDRATAARIFDVDPFTNPRSTLRARHQCMLERGDDGFGLDHRSVPGTYYINPEHCHHGDRCPLRRGTHTWCDRCGYHVATDETRMWFQPPYDLVLEAQAHYGHTRFVALLRLDTSTEWFQRFFGDHDARFDPLCEVIMVPRRERVAFVPPPGVKPSSNPFPHGLYYARAEDVTTAVYDTCYAWPTASYPTDDPLEIFA